MEQLKYREELHNLLEKLKAEQLGARARLGPGAADHKPQVTRNVTQHPPANARDTP